MISPVPDIRNLRIDPTKDSYIVLACDGIWNSLTSQEVVDFVSERLDNLSSGKNGTKDPTTTHLQNICEEVGYVNSLLTL
jgi:protein phosphatase 1G